MSYFKAMFLALCGPWFDYIGRDAVCGNGFEIAAYGLKLVFIYAFLFMGRLLIAVLFPLSALIIMTVDSRNKKRRAELLAEMDKDL